MSEKVAMTVIHEKLITERLAYPSSAIMQYVYKSPILLYRLGLGSLVGQLFMIMTTIGRKSGLPRHTAVEFHQHKGQKYVMVGWSKSDWYQNILVNPTLTIQTASGVEHVRARRLTTVEEFQAAWEIAKTNPVLQGIIKLAGMNLTRDSFIAQKDRFIILTFEPTDEATPPPLQADLRWVLPAIANTLIPMLIQIWLRSRTGKNRQNR